MEEKPENNRGESRINGGGGNNFTRYWYIIKLQELKQWDSQLTRHIMDRIASLEKKIHLIYEIYIYITYRI